MIPAAIICQVVSTHDGDTWTCADGRKIRLAGVDANELDGTCHTVCAPMSAQDARSYVDRLIYRQRLACQPVGRSYKRIVARCSVGGVDLSCRLVAVGAAVRWDRYWRQYEMGECPR